MQGSKDLADKKADLNNVVFSFHFVYMVDNIDRFSYIKSSLHLWDEANLIMGDDSSDMFLDSIDSIFLHQCL